MHPFILKKNHFCWSSLRYFLSISIVPLLFLRAVFVEEHRRSVFVEEHRRSGRVWRGQSDLVTNPFQTIRKCSYMSISLSICRGRDEEVGSLHISAHRGRGDSEMSTGTGVWSASKYFRRKRFTFIWCVYIEFRGFIIFDIKQYVVATCSLPANEGRLCRSALCSLMLLFPLAAKSLASGPR